MGKLKKETIKYYVGTFVMSTIFMIAMAIVSHTQGRYLLSSSISGTGDTITLYGDKVFYVNQYIVDIIFVVVFPFVFTGIFAVIELLSKKLKSKKKRQAEREEEDYSDFVNSVSVSLGSIKKYNVEDFRHFRENKKFQEVLKKLFLIYRDGESENNTYMLCLRKFDKGSKEREATEYLVTFTKKLIEKKNSKDE